MTAVTLDSDSVITKFYLQASYDGKSWSESSVAEYRKKLRDIGSLTVSWTNDEGYSYFRYQRDEEKEDGWTVVDGSTLSVILPYHEGQNRYFVQSSFDSTIWSDSAVTTYNYEKEPVDIPLSLRLNIAPYSSAVYFFYEGHYIDKARTLMGTIYGVSTSIELDWTPFSFMRIYPEFGYAYEMKIQTVIPKQQDMQYIKGGAGIDFLLGVSEKSDIYLGGLGGALMHINNKKYNITPYFGARLGLDTKITDNLTLGAFARVTAAFLPVEDDTLYSSLTLLIDPLSLTLSWNF